MFDLCVKEQYVKMCFYLKSVSIEIVSGYIWVKVSLCTHRKLTVSEILSLTCGRDLSGLHPCHSVTPNSHSESSFH